MSSQRVDNENIAITIIDTLLIGEMSNDVEADNSAHCVSAFRLTGLVLLPTRRESLYKSLLRGGTGTSGQTKSDCDL